MSSLKLNPRIPLADEPGHLLLKKNNNENGEKKRASKRKKKLNERTRLDIIQWSTVVLGTLGG